MLVPMSPPYPFDYKMPALAGEKRKQVQNKILMSCATLDCSAQGPLSNNEGRPRGWFSVDVEGPFPNGRVSMILCPGCAEANLGALIPKAEHKP